MGAHLPHTMSIEIIEIANGCKYNENEDGEDKENGYTMQKEGRIGFFVLEMKMFFAENRIRKNIILLYYSANENHFVITFHDCIDNKLHEEQHNTVVNMYKDQV